jgi:hypothetical protein
MQNDLEIIEVDRIDGTSIIVSFSDGVVKEFSMEQLHALPGKPPAEQPQTES